MQEENSPLEVEGPVLLGAQAGPLSPLLSGMLLGPSPFELVRIPELGVTSGQPRTVCFHSGELAWEVVRTGDSGKGTSPTKGNTLPLHMGALGVEGAFHRDVLWPTEWWRSCCPTPAGTAVDHSGGAAAGSVRATVCSGVADVARGGAIPKVI